jgi:antitoxin VapB
MAGCSILLTEALSRHIEALFLSSSWRRTGASPTKVSEASAFRDRAHSHSSMKTSKLFRKNRSQAVRLPQEFRFKGDHVIVRRHGNGLLLLPAVTSWEPLIQSLSEFSGDFMADREQPAPQRRSGRCR